MDKLINMVGFTAAGSVVAWLLWLLLAVASSEFRIGATAEFFAGALPGFALFGSIAGMLLALFEVV